MMRRAVALLILLIATGCSSFGVGCSTERQYELEGQVLAVDATRGELTVQHKDIKGFMPGMTMPFKVADKAVLAERKPGDLIRATLVVADSQGWLENVVRTGEAELPAEALELPKTPVLGPGEKAPDVALVDQDGRPRRMSDWRGRTVAVTFIYTRCPLPDFCPLMDRHFARVQRDIVKDPALAGRVGLISVSFDPDVDTPAVLRAHGARLGFDPAIWTWLTGTREAVDTFAAPFGVSIIRGDKPQQEIVHNLRTVVLDREARVTKIFNGNDWKPEELLAELRAADAR